MTWLAGEAVTSLVVELRGPDQSVRVRQVRVLGSGEGEGSGVRPLRQHSPLTIQHRACEQETLKVFRLITGQVTKSCTQKTLHQASIGFHQAIQHLVPQFRRDESISRLGFDEPKPGQCFHHV